MEKNDETWVDGQLASLKPDSDWRPDVTQALARVKGQRAPTRRWTRAAAAGIAACLGLLAFPAPRVLASRCVGACESFFLKTANVPQVPSQQAPDFTFKDATGADVRLSSFKGKVVLLNFWAPWCTPCKTEIPWFAEFERVYRQRGFAVIGVSLDDDGWKSVKPYIDAVKIPYRVVVGDQLVAQKYGGVEVLPETLLIDRQGRITTRHVGIVSKADYEREILQLLK